MVMLSAKERRHEKSITRKSRILNTERLQLHKKWNNADKVLYQSLLNYNFLQNGVIGDSAYHHILVEFRIN